MHFEGGTALSQHPHSHHPNGAMAPIARECNERPACSRWLRVAASKMGRGQCRGVCCVCAVPSFVYVCVCVCVCVCALHVSVVVCCDRHAV